MRTLWRLLKGVFHITLRRNIVKIFYKYILQNGLTLKK